MDWLYLVFRLLCWFAVGLAIGYGWNQYQGWRYRKRFPIGEWVEVSPNTRVRRHENNSVEFSSTLSDEHPSTTWRWR